MTLSCPDDWNEHKKLYDRYFGLLRPEEVGGLVPEVEIPVTGGERDAVAAVFDEPGPVALMDGERVDVAVTAAPFLYAPVRRGQVVGSVKFSCDGQPAGRGGADRRAGRGRRGNEALPLEPAVRLARTGRGRLKRIERQVRIWQR